jgi:hypothetical protein
MRSGRLVRIDDPECMPLREGDLLVSLAGAAAEARDPHERERIAERRRPALTRRENHARAMVSRAGRSHEQPAQAERTRLSRRRSAHTSSTMPARASTGWTGSNHVMAPLDPSASSTSLLQVGQPIAKNDSRPPIVTDRASSWVASSSAAAPSAPWRT